MKKQLVLGICMLSILLCACQARTGRISEAADIRSKESEIPLQVSGAPMVDEIEEEGINAGWEYEIDGEQVMIQAYHGKEAEVQVPERIEDYPVTEICQMAFYECENAENIRKITVPDSVTTIGTLAFASLPSLEEVVLPKNLTQISHACFSMDASLKTVILPEGVVEIGEEAFEGCDRLTEIEIPNSVVSIRANAFAKSGLETIIFHEGLTNIESYAFAETNIRNLSFPNSLQVIGYHAFENCGRLKNVTLPESELSLEGFVFYQCENLSNIEFNCIRLFTGGYDFAGTDWMEKQCEEEKQFVIVNGTLLTIKDFSGEIVLPDTVSVIGGQAFVEWTEDGYEWKDNYDITGIMLSDSVTYICEGAFVQLKGVEELVIPKSVQMVEAPQFNGWEEGQTVVIEATKDSYENWENQWNNNKKITMTFAENND